MKNKTLTQAVRFKFAFPMLFSLLLLCAGCPSTPGYSGGNQDTIKVDTSVVVRAIRRDPAVKIRALQLDFKRDGWSLQKDRMTAIKLPRSSKVIRLSHSKADGFTLTEVAGRTRAQKVLALRRAPITKLTSAFSLSGKQQLNESFEYSFTSNDLKSSNFGDCTPFEFYSSPVNGDAYATTPVEPIDVTVEGGEVVYQRRGESNKPTRFDLAGAGYEWDMRPCADPDGVNRVLITAGGLGTIDFVDNIIDPNAMSGSSNEDPFMQEVIREIQAGIAAMEAKEDPCNPTVKNWPATPVICAPFSEVKMVIYCNRELVIEFGENLIRIDLIDCGAKLVVDGENLMIFDGCNEGDWACG